MLLLLFGEIGSGVEDGKMRCLVFICPLTSDFETQFIFDLAVHVPDGVAALVRACDGTEGHVAFADTDSTLVALPGHPCAGEQHQSRPVGGKGRAVYRGGDVQRTVEGFRESLRLNDHNCT